MAKVSAIWLTVSPCCTASETGRISSLAFGATTTPPSTVPVPGRQNSFTNPCSIACIFARALVASGNVTVCAWTAPDSTAVCPTPTVAISGWVKTFAATVARRSGATASPGAFQRQPRGVRHRADREQRVTARDRATVLQRDDHPIGGPLHLSGAGPLEH